MYIVAGLPVIAWEKSAAGKFIVAYNVGITINSLDELDKCIKHISSAEYSHMIDNCLSLRHKLVHGMHIQNVLKKLLCSQS